MKTFVIIFAVLFAGISALPQPSEIEALRSAIIKKDARIVDGIIINIINSIKDRLVANGYDPYVIPEREAHVAVTDDIALSGGLSQLSLVGMANIVINRINYGLLTGNLDMDLALPSVSVSADDVNLWLHIWSLEPNTFPLVKLSGSAGIRNARLEFGARINIGVISGITISNVRSRVSLGGIDSALSLQVIGNDYSQLANSIIGGIIPNLLWDYSSTINDVLLQIILYVIDQLS